MTPPSPVPQAEGAGRDASFRREGLLGSERGLVYQSQADTLATRAKLLGGKPDQIATYSPWGVN